MYFWKIISTFYKDYPKKPIATSILLDSASAIAKPTAKLPTKRKQESPVKATRHVKWGDKKSI